MVKIEDLTYAYGKSENPIFSDFNLSLEKGKVYGLMGKNGAGKSTLLYLICGLLLPQKGRVTINGKDVRERLPETLSDIFIVPEEFELPKIKLADYVKQNAKFYPKFNMNDLQRCLKVFELDEDVNLGSLSMGVKKKVFMSFALATNASLLIMDEPTNGLDIPSKSQFRKFMASGMSDDRVVVISTHQVKDIDKIIDHVMILDENEMPLNASVSEVTRRLIFVESRNRELAQSAIYAQNSLGGCCMVLENTEGEDSELNLETLFNVTLENRELIKKLFR